MTDDQDWQIEYLEESSSSTEEEYKISCLVDPSSDEEMDVIKKRARISLGPAVKRKQNTIREVTTGKAVKGKNRAATKKVILTRSKRPHDSDQLQAGEDAENSSIMRWTGSETKEVMLAYKKYAADLMAAGSFKQKHLVWNNIAAEVKMTPPRICDAYMARMKVENMKKTYLKQAAGIGRPHWRYFGLMKSVMDIENALKSGIELPLLDECSIEDFEKDHQKLPKNDGNPPHWFRLLTEESLKRHEDKMKINSRLCAILESLGS